MKSLQDPVVALKGVGPKRAADLATLGIDTVEDLLTYYPNRYDDVTPADLENVQDRQRITTQERWCPNPSSPTSATGEVASALASKSARG